MLNSTKGVGCVVDFREAVSVSVCVNVSVHIDVATSLRFGYELSTLSLLLFVAVDAGVS